jgi:hypothetical protein
MRLAAGWARLENNDTQLLTLSRKKRHTKKGDQKNENQISYK